MGMTNRQRVGRVAGREAAANAKELARSPRTVGLMTVCNSCVIARGCARMFPAMRCGASFVDGDLTYFANVHGCRRLYYVASSRRPHEFNVNVPQNLAQVARRPYSLFGTAAGVAGCSRATEPGRSRCGSAALRRRGGFFIPRRRRFHDPRWCFGAPPSRGPVSIA